MADTLTLDSQGPMPLDSQQPLPLDSHGATTFGDQLVAAGFGGDFSQHFGQGAGVLPAGVVAVMVALNSAPIVVHWVVQGDTEPIVFRFTVDGIAIPLEGNVSAVAVRMKNRRSHTLILDDVSIPLVDVNDTNAVTLRPDASYFATPGSYWIEFMFTFAAGHIRTHKNRGKAIIEVEPKLGDTTP